MLDGGEEHAYIYIYVHLDDFWAHLLFFGGLEITCIVGICMELWA